MTMESLASVHMFITLTLTYLLSVSQHTESAHALQTVTPLRLFLSGIRHVILVMY